MYVYRLSLLVFVLDWQERHHPALSLSAASGVSIVQASFVFYAFACIEDTAKLGLLSLYLTLFIKRFLYSALGEVQQPILKHIVQTHKNKPTPSI